VYFVDDNELKWFKREYQLSRPCVFIIQIDNYEEMSQLCKEYQKPQTMGQVEILIEEEMRRFHALVRRVERDTFVAVMEERFLGELMSQRFPLLMRCGPLKFPTTCR
jgi:c-di-AMP phosphodiesterase-like protein